MCTRHSAASLPASLQDTNDKADEEFAIVFAAMGVNMETAHYFKQVSVTAAASPDLPRGTWLHQQGSSKCKRWLLSAFSSARCMRQVMLGRVKNPCSTTESGPACSFQHLG